MRRLSDKPNVDEQIPPGWKISHLRPKSVGMIGSHGLLSRKTTHFCPNYASFHRKSHLNFTVKRSLSQFYNSYICLLLDLPESTII